MKKRLVLVLCCYLAMAAPMVASAASSAIKSYGTLKVNKADGSQSIALYASDIKYLQSELDALFAELGVSSHSISTMSLMLEDNGYEVQDYSGRESIVTE